MGGAREFKAGLAACGIGSLPYREPETALRLIQGCLKEILHWPQLPRRGGEHFIYQNLDLLGRFGLFGFQEGRLPILDSTRPDWPEALTSFYELYFRAEEGDPQALEQFCTPRGSAPGLYALLEALEVSGLAPGVRCLKGQVAGPLSVALNLTDGQRRPAYYDPQLRDLLVKTLAMNARWQVGRLARFGLPVLLFVDDPAAGALGTASYITLKREEILEDLAALASQISAAGGVPGVHSCAGVEWPLFFEAGFRVVSFDAYYYFDTLLPYAPELTSFLEGGGILAWGLAPTTEKSWQEDAPSLAGLWASRIAELEARGVPGPLLRRQALLTPSCGLGTLEIPLAEHIYRLLAGLAELLQEKTES